MLNFERLATFGSLFMSILKYMVGVHRKVLQAIVMGVSEHTPVYPGATAAAVAARQHIDPVDR